MEGLFAMTAMNGVVAQTVTKVELKMAIQGNVRKAKRKEK
jgi:hypothetical protein